MSGSRNSEGSKANEGRSLTDQISTGASCGRRDRKTSTGGDDGSPPEGPPRLSPAFVEALLGFPPNRTISRTASAVSATEFHRWRERMRIELSRLESESR